MEVKITHFVVTLYDYMTRAADREYRRELMNAIDVDTRKLLDQNFDGMEDSEVFDKMKMRMNIAAVHVAKDALVLGLIRSVKTRKGLTVTPNQKWLDELPASDFEKLATEALKIKSDGTEKEKKSSGKSETTSAE